MFFILIIDSRLGTLGSKIRLKKSGTRLDSNSLSIPTANMPGVIYLMAFIGAWNVSLRFKKSMNTADVMEPLFVGPPECSCQTDVITSELVFL
jgi:hypothetical protein